MALVRANSVSISGSRRFIASVLPSTTAQSREFCSGKKEPLRKEISFQPYTDEFVKRARQNPTDWKEYKNHEYLNWNKWSYYDLEVQLTKHRLPQPDPKVPEKPRDTVPPAPKPEKK